MKRSFIYLIFCALGITFQACTTTQAVNKPEETSVSPINTEDCSIIATMKDHTDKELCQFLFQLDDGRLLSPALMPSTQMPFFDGKKIKIGYKDISAQNKGMTCDLSDKIVEVTCIEEVEEVRKVLTHEDCQSIKNLFTVEWMRNVVQEVKPQKVFEYEYAIGYLYLFRQDSTSYLYDCLGNKMCDTNDGGDCSSLIESLGPSTLIQVLKN